MSFDLPFRGGQSILPSPSINLSLHLGLMKVKGCRLSANRHLNTYITESDAVPLSNDELERISKTEIPNSTLF